MKTVEYRNSFHNTSARVRVPDDEISHGGECEPMALLSKRQIRRVERALCPRADCKCGGHDNLHPGLSEANSFGRVWCGGGRVIE